MLELTDVTVAYRSGRASTVAVDRVELRVADGEVLALLGPSGCGKSTLLRAVAGLEPIDGGRIRWDGVDLAAVPVHRRGFGLMFQDGVLFAHRSVAGNIGYGLRFTGLDARQRARRVDELLELVGLPGMADRRVTSLSGGQQQRVALARALAPTPRLLLLDEPLAALDATLRARLLEDLRRVLTETSTTALFVTHDQAEAFAVADRVALMNIGRILQVGSPQRIWHQPADSWAAEFVGFTSVLPAGHGVAGLPDGPVALRPAALVADPAGTHSATVVSSRQTPDIVRLTVELPGAGRVQAVSGSEFDAGAAISLRIDDAGIAPLGCPSGTVVP